MVFEKWKKEGKELFSAEEYGQSRNKTNPPERINVNTSSYELQEQKGDGAAANEVESSSRWQNEKERKRDHYNARQQ